MRRLSSLAGGCQNWAFRQGNLRFQTEVQSCRRSVSAWELGYLPDKPDELAGPWTDLITPSVEVKVQEVYKSADHKMPCFNLYILNRQGTCLYYHEWKRPNVSDLPPDDDQKNMFGLLFTLRTFCSALDPVRLMHADDQDIVSQAWPSPRPVSRLIRLQQYAGVRLNHQRRNCEPSSMVPHQGDCSSNKPPLGVPMRIGDGCSFHSFRTNNYKLHFMESPSGLKIVLNTDPEVGDLRDHLWYIYQNILVEFVIKNPLYEHDKPFSFELFTSSLNRYIRQLGI